MVRPSTERDGAARLFFVDSLLVTVAAFVCFIPGLGAEGFRNWDEGLYCAATREMLREGHLLYAIHDGLFDAYYGKPPLINWLHMLSVKVFGFTPFAFRLPSAFAAAMSVFFVHQIASRHLGRAAGAFAGLLLLLSLPYAELGRQSLIEPLLGLFALVALGAHLHAMRPDGMRWAVVSGLAIAASILAKQVVGALPLCAIVLTEAVLRRPKALTRLALAGGIGLLVSGLWFSAVYVRVGPLLFESFVGDHLIGRVSGVFEQHGRRAIDYGQELELNLYHLPIIVAILGAVKLVIQRETRPLGLLFGSYACFHYLVFGVLSRNFLPWYLYAAIPSAAIFAGGLFGKGSGFELRAFILGALSASVAYFLRVDPIPSALFGVFLALLYEPLSIRRYAPSLTLFIALALVLGPLKPRPTEPLPRAFLEAVDREDALLLLANRYQFTYQCHLPEVEVRVVGDGCVGIHRIVRTESPNDLILAPGLSVCELHQRGYSLRVRQDGYRLYSKRQAEAQRQ